MSELQLGISSLIVRHWADVFDDFHFPSLKLALAGRLVAAGNGSADADGEAGHVVTETFVVGDQKYTLVHKRGSM